MEKIKEKKRHYFFKEKNSIVNKIIDEIFLKKFRQKDKVFKLYMESVLITQHINNQIHIKLNIMRHVFTKSEKYENLLYSSQNKFSIKFPLSQSFKIIYDSIFKKTKSIVKYMPFNRKDSYDLSFSMKFKLLGCEIMIQQPEEKKLNFKNNTKKNYENNKHNYIY